jgi:hypothetical protein
MCRRKLITVLATAGMLGLPAAPASAELHRVSVTLVTGQTLTMTIDVAPGTSIETLEIPGLPAPAQSITDLGVVPVPTAEPAGTPAIESPSPAPRYLQPFPVVRIRGSLAPRGANVNLLRVTAPSGATVTVGCAGSGCPLRRLKTGPGRLRAFERFLSAGLRITIRVRREEYVGKYVRLKVRAGRPPARRDACLVPGSPGPDSCPAI